MTEGRQWVAGGSRPRSGAGRGGAGGEKLRSGSDGRLGRNNPVGTVDCRLFREKQKGQNAKLPDRRKLIPFIIIIFFLSEYYYY